MKKILLIIIFTSFFSNPSLSDSYYFKDCKISNAVVANYIINLDRNLIEVELKAVDGTVQNFSDKIKTIEKNKIVSEKIQSSKGEDLYYQYFLNSKSNTVTKQQFKKRSGDDIDLFNLVESRKTSCSNIKGNWNQEKLEKQKIKKELKEILKAQEQIKKEQSELVQCQGNNHKLWTGCKGSYKDADGHKYKGIIKGISIYAGGAKYAGEFKNFEPHGYGTFVWANGDKYMGTWLNGKSHGDGTKIWNDGRKYLGNFKNDKLHGEGTLFYLDGSKYVGQFQNGKRHGDGTFTFADGSAYLGKFIDGKEHGTGECISIDGLSVPCLSKKEVRAKDFTGRDTRKISIEAKKWIRISQYEANSKKGKKIMDKLKNDFEIKASELCSPKENYKVLEKKIEVLEINETPAYGLEAKLKIGINGVVECI